MATRISSFQRIKKIDREKTRQIYKHCIIGRTSSSPFILHIRTDVVAPKHTFFKSQTEIPHILKIPKYTYKNKQKQTCSKVSFTTLNI